MSAFIIHIPSINFTKFRTYLGSYHTFMVKFVKIVNGCFYSLVICQYPQYASEDSPEADSGGVLQKKCS